MNLQKCIKDERRVEERKKNGNETKHLCKHDSTENKNVCVIFLCRQLRAGVSGNDGWMQVSTGSVPHTVLGGLPVCMYVCACSSHPDTGRPGLIGYEWAVMHIILVVYHHPPRYGEKARSPVVLSMGLPL